MRVGVRVQGAHVRVLASTPERWGGGVPLGVEKRGCANGHQGQRDDITSWWLLN